MFQEAILGARSVWLLKQLLCSIKQKEPDVLTQRRPSASCFWPAAAKRDDFWVTRAVVPVPFSFSCWNKKLEDILLKESFFIFL